MLSTPVAVTVWGAATLLALLGVLRTPLRQRWRAWRVARQPFPAAWRATLRQHWPAYRQLPADVQLTLKKRIQVFLAEVPIIGCQGLVVTDTMRLLIAAPACLLVLHAGPQAFTALRQVLVYPGAFVVPRQHTDESGVVHADQRVLAGESWTQGQVLLSWDDVQQGAAVADDGRHVVLHEFAHQLDQAKGVANGLPAGLRRWQRGRWTAVMQAEYQALRRRVNAGESGLLDPYGATDPAEFFAVATETFFEQGPRLSTEHPALYAQLSLYYRLSPALWA